MSFDVAHGVFETSHVAECPDVAPECATTFIPPHQHRVALGLTHTELTAEYGVRDGMELALRLPYDVKAMTVRYTTLDGAPFTPPYGDIHHRTETLRGISDPSLDLDVAAGDAWIVALGHDASRRPHRPRPDRPRPRGEDARAHPVRQRHVRAAPRSAMASRPLVRARGGEAESVREPRGLPRAVDAGLVRRPEPPRRPLHIRPRLNASSRLSADGAAKSTKAPASATPARACRSRCRSAAVVVAPSIYRELWTHGSAGQSFRQGTTWSIAVSRVY